MQAVNGFSVLSAEEEKALAEELYYHQNLDAARKLVMANLRFVIHIAKSYSGYGLAQGDLVQEGNVGLMKAVKRFNPERACASFLSPCTGSKRKFTNLSCATGA